MNFLLDTHTFLWFLNGDKQLPKNLVNYISDTSNNCFLSIASIWEIGIKKSINKLELNIDLLSISDFILQNKINILPIEIEHIQILLTLPFHHRDPFDRLIISQGIFEKLDILTKDSAFKEYSVVSI